MKRIIIAGGNTAGTIVANRLARKLDEELDKEEVEILVLNKTDEHIYLPGQVFVAFGLEDPAELKRNEKELLDPRIKFLYGQKGTVTKIDPANHSVTTADGSTYSYDYLVIATGAESNWDEIPGYKAVAVSPYELDYALKMKEELERFEGGTIVINTAKIPYRCPPAPIETALILSDYLKKRGIREKTRIIYTYPLQGVIFIPSVNKPLLSLLEQKGIEVHSPFNVVSVDPNQKIIESQEGEKIKFDLLIGVPSILGAKVIEDSGIGDKGRWVPTDGFTLRMKGYSNVYVIGDATDLPLPKAGSVADSESYVIAHNIANDIKGNLGVKYYEGDVFCYIATGIGTATYAKANYTTEPKLVPSSQALWWSKVAYNKLYWSVTAKAAV